MTKISETNLAGFKVALKKTGIEYKTDEEYQEAFDNLVGYLDILNLVGYFDMWGTRYAAHIV